MSAVDSSFILGSVPKQLVDGKAPLAVRVNGLDFAVHADGGFIAFVPLQSGEFVFDIAVHKQSDLKSHPVVPPVPLAEKQISVLVPELPSVLSPDTLRIVAEYQPPRGDLVLLPGDLIEVSFIGTTGASAWFAIPGVVDSVAMAETPPRSQLDWGEAVFGAGATGDTPLTSGVFSGFYSVSDGSRTDSVRIQYFLASDSAKYVDTIQAEDPRDGIVMRESSYSVTLNPRDYPFTVRFKDSMLVIRHAPTKGYLSTFQPRGVQALVIGAEAEWYKIRLSETQTGWVNSAQVERLPYGILPPRSEITSIRYYSYPESLVVVFPTSGLHPYHVSEDDRRTLRIQLFGVLSNTDWIRYDLSDSLIDLASWAQPERNLYELTLRLRQDIWGYDCYYVGSSFYVKLIRPPVNRRTLRGMTIVLDPGHSEDPGSIGPTGYTEAEANLALSLAVRELLMARGAEVVMTRPDMRHVPLMERPVIAKLHNADLYVSIHNNALPDGVNPFANFGVSTFYYHPHSLDLARAIQTQMVAITKLPDHGLYHGNLAVIRPPQYPAVLVECAFMILPEHEAMLRTRRFRNRVARAITTGIENFLQGYNNGR